MGKNIAQKPMAQFPCFRKFLNAIVEDIPVVAHTFLIQRRDAEYIGTITDLLAHSVALELQHQMRAISDVAAGGLGVLHFRRAVQPNRFQTSLLENLMRFLLRGQQKLSGHIGIVVYRDTKLWSRRLCGGCVLGKAGRRPQERQYRATAKPSVHGGHLSGDSAFREQVPQCRAGNAPVKPQ